MRNKLVDLNNHLFEQIERLSDDDLEGEDLKQEIDKSKQIENIAKQIINNGRLVLDTQKFLDNQNNVDIKYPKMLGHDE